MFKADVYRVLIASPSDVAEERAAAHSVLGEWNSTHSAVAQAVLLPLVWETDAVPEMGDRPQAILNRQLVKIADLLVAVFKHRLGTPTGRADSGTVEEIEEHLRAGRPAMIYFFDGVHPPDSSVDPDQVRRLARFRAQCESRGLIRTYPSVPAFKDLFRTHLTLGLRQWFPALPVTGDTQGTPGAGVSVSLSTKAVELLQAGVADRDGEIRVIEFDGGRALMARGRDFLGDLPRRQVAEWEDAFRELVASGLVRDEGGNGHVFSVTKAGYEAHDRIVKQDDA